jgi:hypothetical protein
MAEKLPFMPFYGADFYDDERVSLMTLAEEAVYLRLIWRQWREGSLPAERVDLEKLARGPVTPRVLECLPRCDDGRRRNRRVEEVRGQHLGTSEKRSAAGKNGRAKQLAQVETGAPPAGFLADAGPGPGRAQAEPAAGPGRRRANAGQSDTESEPDVKASATNVAGAGTAPRNLAQDRAALMGVVREVCYAPDGKPREPRGDATDADILTGWLRKGRSPEEIERAIRGVRLAIDANEIDFAPPKQKFGLKILNHTHSGARHVWEIALDAYGRDGVRESAKRGRSGFASVAELLPRRAS